MHVATRARIQFGLLGSLRVWVDGDPIEINAPKQRVLLALLLIYRNQPVSSDKLIEGLWDGLAPDTAQAALQVYISQLRKALGAEQITTTTNGYRLNAPDEAVDAGRFAAYLGDARRALAAHDTAQAADLFQAALDSWHGQALSDFTYSSWALAEIRRLDEQRTEAQVGLLEARLDQGQRGLVEEIEPLIEEHPYREQLRGLLARALYQDGRQVAALRSIETARLTLIEDLGIDLSPELKAIERRILQQHPDMNTAAASSAPPEIRTSFVGRDRERREVHKLLADRRMVTLTGPGGVGKSRLAMEVVSELLDEGDRQLWWVDLTTVEDGKTLARHVLRQSGLRQLPQLSTRDALVGGIGRRQIDLVLDTCEHLLTDVADLAASLLASCPNVTLLATSREPIRLPGESVYEVGPLSTDEHQPELAPAVRLFMDRAYDSYPGAATRDLESAQVSEVCRRLDGLPLAIEIAAARLRDAGLDELVQQVKNVAQRDALPDRLQATIEWSYGLLGQRSRLLFESLSVFRGSFDSAAAQQVCSSDELGKREVLDLLSLLVDKSLLSVEPTQTGRRYRLLDTIAAFSRRQLAERGDADLLGRHAAHYLALAIDLRGPLRGSSNQVDRLREVTIELPNLRAAFDYASNTDPRDLLPAATALNPYWAGSGNRKEGIELLELAMGTAEDPDPCLAVEAKSDHAFLVDLMGDQERADVLARSALGLAETSCPQADHHALFALAHANINSRDPALAVEYGERAIKRATEVGDSWTSAWALLITGTALYELAQPEASLPKLEAATELFLENGDSFGLGWAIWCLGVNARWRGDLVDFEDRMHDSLALFTRTQDPWGIGSAAWGIGEAARLAGEYSNANEQYSKALEFAERSMQTGNAIVARASLAQIALDQGQEATAWTQIHEALAAVSADTYWAVVSLCLPAARWMHQDGQVDLAAALLRTARRHWEELGLSWEPDVQAEWQAAGLRFEVEIGSTASSEAVDLTQEGVMEILHLTFDRL